MVHYLYERLFLPTKGVFQGFVKQMKGGEVIPQVWENKSRGGKVLSQLEPCAVQLFRTAPPRETSFSPQTAPHTA